MKKIQTTGKSPNGQTKDIENNWKAKAISRRKEVGRLSKRLKAVLKGRDAWKAKAISRRKEVDCLNKRLKEVLESRDNWKAKCKASKNSVVGACNLSSEKATNHHYSLVVVALIIALYNYGGMSLRSCRHSLCCMFLCLGLSVRVPSHSSIRNWLCKCGMYRTKTQRDDVDSYVVYVDESISFGSEKMLLILGVPLEKIPQDRCLSHEDMQVLFVGASHEWKAEHIEEELSKIAAHHSIAYVVSDQGSNLRKAYKLLNYMHIEDCTHILANALKKIYDKDETFKTFKNLIGILRRDWKFSKTNSKYVPPTMRGKMRFANIFACVNWAKKMLRNWDELSEEVQARLSFLKEQSDFIKALIQAEAIFKIMCTKLKTKGFTLRQKQEILKELAKIKGPEKTDIFINNCKEYLDNLSLKSETLKAQHLLCSSDIIESFFGKFKTKVNPNARGGLTEFIFTIATFGQPFSTQEVKQALENIQCKDLVLVKRQPKVA